MKKLMKERYLLLLLVILSIASLFIGVSSLSIKDVLAFNEEKINLLMISRVPRLMSILVAGVGLSVSGLIMQQISRNKFVSPTTAATADFAKLGVLFTMMYGGRMSQMAQMMTAFIFAMAGTLLFMSIMKHIKIKNIIFVPLVGLMLGKVVGSITSYFAYKYDLVQNLTSWMEGNLSVIMAGNYEMLYLSIPVVVIGFLYANQLTIAGMGEDFAKNLGLNYQVIVNLGLGIVSLITAVTLVTVGNIPFLGLIIPNIVSLYAGDNLRHSLYHTALIGPIFLLICDILGRIVIYPFEVSIGMMVGVIGGVIFLTMLVRRANTYA